MNKRNDDHSFSRRVFLHGAISASLLPLASFASNSYASNSEKSRVIVVRDVNALDEDSRPCATTINQMLENGLLALTGASNLSRSWGALFSKTERIAIKSNISVEAVHTDIQSVLLHGIASSGIAEDQIRIWDRNRGGVGLSQADASSWTWAPGFGPGGISKAVEWADGLINLPRLKSHGLSVMSGALKNWVGAVTNINCRDENVVFPIHANQCADVGMINALPVIQRKCRLIVVDALLPVFHDMDTQKPWAYKGLVIGTDPVAVDSVCWRILQGCRSKTSGVRHGHGDMPLHISNAEATYGLGHCGKDLIDTELIGWPEDSFI
jgi:Domain of unknown function (DUF362)